MPDIDIPKLNEIFALAVDLCRYCGGKCNLSIKERPLQVVSQKSEVGSEESDPTSDFRLQTSNLERSAYPYAECPSCKETLKGYEGMFLIWRVEEASLGGEK